MKAHALTLHWHTDSQPIYSAQFQPSRSGRGRLATAGGDNNVRIWRVELGDGSFPSVSYLSTLVKHTQAVNVVRFDFNGDLLASAGDDGNVLLWTLAEGDEVRRAIGDDPEDHAHDRETWRIKHLCRSSMAEIYDIAWSPDSQYLIAGSMDNIARIYSASTGLCIRQIAEHNHYVQGVAWDPLNEYVATQSSDRSVHIFTLRSRDGQFALNPHNKVSRAELPYIKHVIDIDSSVNSSSITTTTSTSTSTSTPPIQPTALSPSPVFTDSPAGSTPGTPSVTLPMNPPPVSSHSRRSSFGSNSVRRSPSPSPALPLPAVRPADSPKLGYRMAHLYHNEGLTSFFRRLTFTPDGSLLLTPAGQYKHTTASGSEEMINTVYIYTRAGLNQPPVAHLPSLRKPAIVVRCSPIKYKLRQPGEEESETQNITIETSSSSATSEPFSLPNPQIPTSVPSTTPATNSSQAFVLPYRIVYAVATQDSVFIYDTQQTSPLCVVSNLHYATFTDLTWSPDGRILFMTSTDGFCSDIVFDQDELGVAFVDSAEDSKDGRSSKHHHHPRSASGGSSGEFYFPPTPASASNTFDGRDVSASPTTGPIMDQELAPIISPVPGLSTPTSAFTSGKRESSDPVSDCPSAESSSVANQGTEGAPGGPEKKKRRVAPMLVGEVRR
ncbi:WD40-repeat-containing domain protein [Lipomyces oligophaga]|uniref:WD40-repeat-containing domain protein n=1 Tax=Lipomyces oligophaga TaxID=45792 RepID=UPI0034D01357